MGEWPQAEIDHKDLNKTNNAWDNLRCATRSQNMNNIAMHRDNKSGFKCVSLKKSINKWRSQISVNGKRIHLGYFDDPRDAYFAYCDAVKRHNPEFGRIA